MWHGSKIFNKKSNKIGKKKYLVQYFAFPSSKTNQISYTALGHKLRFFRRWEAQFVTVGIIRSAGSNPVGTANKNAKEPINKVGCFVV